MNIAPIVKLVRAYEATEWEIFISEWQKGLTQYAAVKRLGGAGDHGRDVIGLAGPQACAGVWDNYQCKHYEVPLKTSKACEDAGKIIFHAFRGVFSPPRRCSFVAPRGPTMELRDLLLNPDKFKNEVVSTWDTRVAGRIVAGEKHVLVGKLADFVKAYDFTSFAYDNLDEILDGHRKTAYWASRFGGYLPAAPKGTTPSGIAQVESIYVGKLFAVYSEMSGQSILSVDDLAAHAPSAEDLQRQRVRFYEAEAFMAHYRDQTEPGTVEDFAEQIYDSIEPSLRVASSAQDRLVATLNSAAYAQPAHVLTSGARVLVRQGVCHQLANAGDRVTWKV